MVEELKGNFFWKLYCVGIFLLFLQSLRFWLFWDFLIPIHLFSALVALIGIFFHRYLFSVGKSQAIAFILLFIFEIYFIYGGSFNGYLASILKIIILGSCICLKVKYRVLLFQFLLKWFSIILIPSILYWLVYLAKAASPVGQLSFNEDQYIFDNYFFFLKSKTLIFEDIVFPRFSSYFLEPGHLGMVTSFLIIATNFNWRNRFVQILLIATVLSFSLAAFIILGFAYWTKVILVGKRAPLKLIVLGFTCFLTVSFFKNYNGGDNVFNNLILERIKVEDGDLKGNNRTNLVFDNYFDDHFYDDPIFGLGNFYMNNLHFSSIAGIKVFLLTFGIFGVFLFFILYLTIYNSSPSKVGLILFIAYVLCFLQASYPLWECLLFTFICGIANLRFEENYKSVKAC